MIITSSVDYHIMSSLQEDLVMGESLEIPVSGEM